MEVPRAACEDDRHVGADLGHPRTHAGRWKGEACPGTGSGCIGFRVKGIGLRGMGVLGYGFRVCCARMFRQCWGGVVELSSVRVFIELLHGFLWFRKR